MLIRKNLLYNIIINKHLLVTYNLYFGGNDMKKKLTSALCLSVLLSSIPAQATANKPVGNAVLNYEFAADTASKAGYAEGTISLKVQEAGKYFLYWADETKALEGYYPIAELQLKKGETGTFSFAEQTAIPAEAVSVIAVKATDEEEMEDEVSVADAVTTFAIPKAKQLPYKNSDALYTFGSYSDIHIDEEHWGSTPGYWWQYSEKNWAEALKYAADKEFDFIISSGDQVTNASQANLDKEWKAYQYILSESDYVNPIWESSGNHEVRQDAYVSEGLSEFVKGTGLNGSKKALTEGKPYYALTEPVTGDIFIFMALENGYRPAQYDEFSDEQLDWLEDLLESNQTREKNIYIVQHALISKYGAGDDVENPYYGGSINPELESAKRFKSIIEQHPDVIWISGHTHQDFAIGNNYSNNNGTSCHMIHNSSVANPTQISKEGHSLDYSFNEESSQGYYVQTFKNSIIFNGANLYDKKIYPAYSYIIDGKTSKLENPPLRDQYQLVEGDVTSGMLNSVLANANTMLGVCYEYSSYDQYQALKKCYYEYKDCKTKEMTAEELKEAYSKLSHYIGQFHQITQLVEAQGK